MTCGFGGNCRRDLLAQICDSWVELHRQFFAENRSRLWGKDLTCNRPAATAHQLVCNSLSDLIRGFLDTNEERSAWDHFTSGGGANRTLTNDQVLAALAQSPEFASAQADAAAACALDPNNSDTVTINFGTTAGPPFVALLGGLSVTFTYSCHGCCVAWLAQINDPYDFDPRGFPGFTDRSPSGEGKTLGVRLAQLISQCGWQSYNTTGTASGGSCPQ